MDFYFFTPSKQLFDYAVSELNAPTNNPDNTAAKKVYILHLPVNWITRQKIQDLAGQMSVYHRLINDNSVYAGVQIKDFAITYAFASEEHPDYVECVYEVVAIHDVLDRNGIDMISMSLTKEEAEDILDIPFEEMGDELYL